MAEGNRNVFLHGTALLLYSLSRQQKGDYEYVNFKGQQVGAKHFISFQMDLLCNYKNANDKSMQMEYSVPCSCTGSSCVLLSYSEVSEPFPEAASSSVNRAEVGLDTLCSPISKICIHLQTCSSIINIFFFKN